MKTLYYGIIIGLGVLVLILLGIVIYLVCRRHKKEQIVESVCNEPLVTVSPVVVNNSVIFTNPNHTPLLQPNTFPQNGPLVIDANAPPLPMSVAFQSADFPSVTQQAQFAADSSEFPSVTPK